jgi:3-isopropylmalate/(R)-2-methylmalate dehydratase large subunit
MSDPQSMFDKIWRRHVVTEREDGECLIYVDRNFVHEGPFYAFDALRLAGRKVRRPLKQFAIADHYLPSLNRAAGPRRHQGSRNQAHGRAACKKRYRLSGCP